MLAAADTVNVLFALIGAPAFVLGCLAIFDRVQRHRRAEEEQRQRVGESQQRQEDRRTIDLVASALFGPDKAKWPSAGEAGSPSVTTLMETVARQVHPPNGATVAINVEEIKRLVIENKKLVEEQNDAVNDLQKGMARLATVMVEHVSDGHGARRSW